MRQIEERWKNISDKHVGITKLFRIKRGDKNEEGVLPGLSYPGYPIVITGLWPYEANTNSTKKEGRYSDFFLRPWNPSHLPCAPCPFPQVIPGGVFFLRSQIFLVLIFFGPMFLLIHLSDPLQKSKSWVFPWIRSDWCSDWCSEKNGESPSPRLGSHKMGMNWSIWNGSGGASEKC